MRPREIRFHSLPNPGRYRPGPLFHAEAAEGLTYTPSPGNVLVIGFGAGSITQAALMPTEVRKVTVVELSGSVI